MSKFSTKIWLKYSDLIADYSNTEYSANCVPDLETCQYIHKQRLSKPYYKFGLNFLESIKNENIKSVLDYGGSTGIGYFLWADFFNLKKYIIIEQKSFYKICNLYWKYKEYPISYVIDVSEVKENIDIIYSRSGFQYCSSPWTTLVKFCNLNPKYLFLDHSHFIENKSHYRIQHYKQLNIPIYLISIPEAECFLSNYGYKLLSKELNTSISLTMKSKNPDYKVDGIYNIIFKKI